MKRALLIAGVLAFCACGKSEPKAKPKPSPAELSLRTAVDAEKDKAFRSIYPNDLGPDKLEDSVVHDYPDEIRDGYVLLLDRCSQCHTAARPLNSRFVELSGGEAAVAALKKSSPELFKSPEIRQIEASVWNRYVKRMMSKPGCGAKFGGRMTDADGKLIWKFLVYDGEKRKLGANAAAWAAHRRSLIGEFRYKNRGRYEELARDGDL